MRWVERHLGGHKRIGRVTVYGENAMHWGVTIWTRRWGYLCFRLPLPSMGRWWPLYFYASPNATPWAATLMLGRRFSRDEHRQARERRRAFGHGFNVDDNYTKLRQINGYADEIAS